MDAPRCDAPLLLCDGVTRLHLGARGLRDDQHSIHKDQQGLPSPTENTDHRSKRPLGRMRAVLKESMDSANLIHTQAQLTSTKLLQQLSAISEVRNWFTVGVARNSAILSRTARAHIPREDCVWKRRSSQHSMRRLLQPMVRDGRTMKRELALGRFLPSCDQLLPWNQRRSWCRAEVNTVHGLNAVLEGSAPRWGINTLARTGVPGDHRQPPA